MTGVLPTTPRHPSLHSISAQNAGRSRVTKARARTHSQKNLQADEGKLLSTALPSLTMLAWLNLRFACKCYYDNENGDADYEDMIKLNN